MLAGERPAGLDAGVEDLARPAARPARPRPRPRRRRARAGAGCRRRRGTRSRRGARSGRELLDPPQRLRKARARDDAVLDVVVGADPAHRGERGLAAVPERGPLGVVGARPAPRAAPPAAHSSCTRRRSARPPRPARRARRAGRRRRRAEARHGRASSAAWIVSASIISTAAGTMPAPMIADTTSPAASVDGNAASSVSTRCGRGTTRTVISVAIPSVPSRPDERRRAGRAAPSRSSRSASPSASTTRSAEDVVDVKPYFRQWAPPEFSATLPPIVHTCWLDGSGA